MHEFLSYAEVFFLTLLILDRVAQLVSCLTTDVCLNADPGVASLILVQSHNFAGIDHEIISTTILLHSADSFKKGCCPLQAKICGRSTVCFFLALVNRLFKLVQEKSVVR